MLHLLGAVLFSREEDAAHGIQDSPVGDPILAEEDLLVEAGLQGVASVK
jgi:hypothetical protein